TSTSAVEITQISLFGIWLLCGDKERFLPYEDFPWFKNATVSQIHDVQLLHGKHLYWPALDVDLTLDMLDQPHAYPLMYAGEKP
ncbi:MAG: DUF2442 domain-containing protein, partial [Kiritimatiellae bacterium]|nr:DUF2442 domain-containing protein [Kiritimatiellia bacterium]